MNKLQIQNIDPNSEHCGKTYGEENLHRFLVDVGCRIIDKTVGYRFLWRCGWWELGFYTEDYNWLWFALDPSRFQVSFQNTMPVSEVRKMVQEMRQSAYCRPNSVVIKDEILDALDGIANKYLPQE